MEEHKPEQYAHMNKKCNNKINYTHNNSDPEIEREQDKQKTGRKLRKQNERKTQKTKSQKPMTQ